MEQLHDIVLNMHGAVACACHQNVSLTGSITQLNDTEEEVMTLVHALHSVEAVWQVGPVQERSLSLLLPPRMTSSFSADARPDLS